MINVCSLFCLGSGDQLLCCKPSHFVHMNSVHQKFLKENRKDLCLILNVQGLCLKR